MAELRKRNNGWIQRSERPAYGMCYICGSPVKDGEKLCRECSVRATDNLSGGGDKPITTQ